MCSQYQQKENAQTFEIKKELGVEKHIVGIDLGTTFSAVGIWDDGAVDIRANYENQRTTQSIVSYIFEDGQPDPAQILVGPAAKRNQIENSKGTICDSKRMIGRTFNDIEDYIKERIWEFDVQKSENNRPVIKIGDFSVSPVDVSAEILKTMKIMAEEGLNSDEFDQVVLSHPAYFDNAQKAETKEAAIRAGFKNVEMISEPLAAALAYGVKKRFSDGNILVFDLGGGTFDVSIIAIKEGKMEVKYIDGNSKLGGRDFDHVLFEMVREKINLTHGKDIRKYKTRRQRDRIRQKCEEVKVALSSHVQQCIYLEEYYPKLAGEKIVITRKEFEDNCRTLIDKAIAITRSAVKKSKLGDDQINEVLLVGGSSRIPMVKDLLHRMFGKRLNVSLNPEEIVCYGATLRAAQLAGDEEAPQMELIEAIPLSLGIETEDGRFISMISKNTQVPFKETYTFGTSKNNQPAMTFQIYEGESPIAKNNRPLGHIEIPNLEMGCAQTVSVDLTLELDENGLLRAEASHRPRWNPGQTVNVEMTIDYWGQRATDAEVGQMLRGVAENKDAAERKSSVLEAADALDIAIKRVQYGIQMSDANSAQKEAWENCIVRPYRKWLTHRKGIATVRELEIKLSQFVASAQLNKIPKHDRPRVRNSERITTKRYYGEEFQNNRIDELNKMNYANVATTSGANIIVPKAPKPSAIVSVSCKRTAAQPPRSSNPKKAKEAIATAAKGAPATDYDEARGGKGPNLEDISGDESGDESSIKGFSDEDEDESSGESVVTAAKGLQNSLKAFLSSRSLNS